VIAELSVCFWTLLPVIVVEISEWSWALLKENPESIDTELFMEAFSLELATVVNDVKDG